ncbi:MAG: protein phosphatase 2C domain-containing protein [Gemmatimonadales bacterium]
MTHQGLVRKENQDHFLYCTLHKMMRVGGSSLPNRELLELPSQRLASVAAVADGVGGRSGGEAASRAAIEALAGYVTHATVTYYTANARNQDDFLEQLREAARLGHQAVQARATREDDDRGAATTLTVLVAVWPALYVLQVGDSRCYRYRAGRVDRLTRDQTMAQDLVDSGILKPDDVPRSRFANVLSSSLGGRSSSPVVSMTDMQVGDVYLLCTDGLTKHVDDARIAERLGGLSSSEQACRALIDDALADGGTDNIAAVVLRAIVR